MDLYLIRHGVAEERENWNAIGKPDQERPLIHKGVKRIKKAIPAFRQLLQGSDLLLSSEYTRAIQTAELLEGAVGREHEITCYLNCEANVGDLINYLRELDSKRIVCVGHEPFLSELVYELTGVGEEFSMKKAGMVHISSFESEPILQAYYSPKTLRNISEIIQS